MIDLYLKADNQYQLHQTLIARGFEQDEESGALYHPRILLDEIGVIYSETGQMQVDEAGLQYPETKALSGYHANLRVLDDSLAEPFYALAIEVNNPMRIWA